MKRVYASQNELAHAWANGLTPSGRCNGGMSFEGEVLYSYGAAIGQRVEGADGERLVMINATKYSITSTRHVTFMYRAIRHDNMILCHPCQHLARRVDRLYPVRLEEWQGALTRIEKQAAVIANPNRAPRAVGSLVKDLESLVWGLANYISVTLDGKSQARPLRDLAKKIREILAGDGVGWVKGAREAMVRAEAKEAKRREAQMKEKAAKAVRSQELWLAGKTHKEIVEELGGDLSGYGDYQLLRIQPGHPEIVETNRGARVTLKAAVRAWEVLRGAVSGATMEVEGFKGVVREDGEVWIGCHRFTRAELERFATILGLEVG